MKVQGVRPSAVNQPQAATANQTQKNFSEMVKQSVESEGGTAAQKVQPSSPGEDKGIIIVNSRPESNQVRMENGVLFLGGKSVIR